MSYPSTRGFRCLVLLSVVAAFALVPGELRAQGPRTLFEIARSKNKNVLKYEVEIAGKGEPKRDQPVSAHWVMHEAGGHREPLTWFERQFAYGWEVVGPVGADGFVFKLSALARRPVRVVRRGAAFAALVSIRDRPSYLERIYVQTREGGAFPKVLYVDLFGRDLATGRPASERLLNE